DTHAQSLIPDEKRRRRALGELYDLLESGDAEGLAQALQNIGPSAGEIRLGRDVFTPDEVEAGRYQNDAVYIFKSTVLRDALDQYTGDTAQGEEYLTDAVNILANSSESQSSVALCEFESDEILTYNNPEELVAVEDAFRRRLQVEATENGLATA